MDRKNFYNHWIDLVKKNTPSLENPEEMTASIMEKIETPPVNVFSKKITYWAAVLSGAAACGVFCLMIYEFNRPLMNVPDRPFVSAITISSKPEKIEDISLYMKEKERKAILHHKLRTLFAQNYKRLYSPDNKQIPINN